MLNDVFLLETTKMRRLLSDVLALSSFLWPCIKALLSEQTSAHVVFNLNPN